MTGTFQFEAAELSVLETGATVFVPITRTGDLSGRSVVQYATNNQTAIAGSDYVSAAGTVVFEPGVARVLVPVSIINDTASEATEFFGVSIINVSSGTLSAPRTAQVSILDDENPVTVPPDPPLVSDFDVRLVDNFTGLNQPISMEFSPVNSNLIFVAEKAGLVKTIDTTTGQVSTILNIQSQVNNIQDRGLLDIAIHPDLANSPYLYAFYVVDPPGTTGTGNAGVDGGGNRYSHVVRYTLDASNGYKTVVPNSGTVIVGNTGRSASDISGGGAIDSTSDFTARDSELNTDGSFKQNYLKVDSRSHAGGSLEFGPDGKLYISIGDGTSFNATDTRTVSVQNINSLSGKILRVDPVTGQGLADNPFYSGQSLDANSAKVYQLGLRNPFSISFDQNGQLFITDTGWNNYEEVNSGGAGANFGWPYFEGGDLGANIRTPGYQSIPSAAAFYAAVASGQIVITPAYRGFSHTSTDPGFQVQAVVGSDDVIRGSAYPVALNNDYVFADYSQGEIFAVDVFDRTNVKFLIKVPGIAPVHYKMGADGYLYFVDIGRGAIGHLEIATPGAAAPVLTGSLQAEYFNISAVTSLSQVNFNTTPTFAQDVTRIAQAETSGSFFPGGNTDNFAVKYTGQVKLDKGGYYTFYLNSDDGSRLFVDGREVINHDGLHGLTEKTGSVFLTAGEHVIKLIYFESTGGAGLDLDWSGPLFPRQDLNFNGVNSTRVVNDIANTTQYLNGTAGGSETFYIDGDSAAFGWQPLTDGTGYVVWGPSGFDLLYNSFDAIRFNDRTVSLGALGGEVRDIPNQTQYLSGTGNSDTFVINGRTSDYQFQALTDGTGHVVWGPTGFDLLYGFETIRFNDGAIDLTGQSGRTVNDIVGVTQFVQGTPGQDTFVIDANSTGYQWGRTEDGQDHVVYNGSNFDLLYDWEFIRFNDRTVGLL
jgi:glucose/arabinose dehydrogenase